jgi:exosortase
MAARSDIAGSTPMTIERLKNDYLTWGLVGVSFVLVIVIYAHTMGVWWRSWWVPESRYSHGILVPFISAFAVYAERERISKVQIRPNFFLGVIALLLVMSAGMAYRAARVPSMESISLPLFILCAIVLLLGTRMAYVLLFPCLFLLFMVPWPGFLLARTENTVQLWSTIAATKILQLLQFDASHEGITILMPSIAVKVATACSGFRTLISLFAFSTFFAYMKDGPWWGRICLVVSALPLGLVANSIRITMVALVGEFWGEDVMHVFHDYSGYIMLVFAFVALELISRMLKCRKFRLAL